MVSIIKGARCPKCNKIFFFFLITEARLVFFFILAVWRFVFLFSIALFIHLFIYLLHVRPSN